MRASLPLVLGWLAFASANQPGRLGGFGSSMMALSDATILEKLKQLYAEKLRPLEKKGLYHELCEPALSDAWFDAKPMVLLLGQYSVGKTSFIRYLLGRDFPNQHVGPEPTTDRFVSVMYGERDKVMPGNALTSQPDTPFHSLRHFGASFLDKLECASLPAPILRRISLVDTPGVQAGEKQKGGRGYDFLRVVKWWAQHSDRICLFFDPNKLDISDEFRDVIEALRYTPPPACVCARGGGGGARV
jgi:EH domain-containing protein 1